MQYDLYNMDIFKLLDHVIPKKHKKKLPKLHDQFVYGMAECSTTIPRFYQDLLFNISCDDYKWAENGKKIIFIGEKMATDLINSKAIVSESKLTDFHITLPFSDFMISLPRGFVAPDGTHLPPFMATVATERSSLLEMMSIVEECKEKYKGSDQSPVGVYNSNPRNIQRLSFRFKMGNRDGQTITQILEPEEIPALITAESAAEFVEMRRGDSMVSTRALPLADEESAIGYYILKLLVSLSMYHEATDGKYLLNGLPSDSGSVGINTSMREKKQYKYNYINATNQ